MQPGSLTTRSFFAPGFDNGGCLEFFMLLRGATFHEMFRPRSRPPFFGIVQAEHEDEHDDEDDF